MKIKFSSTVALTIFFSVNLINSNERIFENNHPICEALFPDTENVTAILVQMILQETRGIKIAIFYLSEPQIINALIDAKRRNVDIQIIIDKGCITNLTLKKFHTIATSDIQLFVYKPISIYKKALMHNKYCIFESRSIVWTGSFNFTYSAQRYNKENVIILENYKITEKYRNNFAKLKQSTIPFKDYKKYQKWLKNRQKQSWNHLIKELDLIHHVDINLFKHTFLSYEQK